MKNCIECNTAHNRRSQFCSTNCKGRNYYKRNRKERIQINYARQKVKRIERKEDLVRLKGGACERCGYSDCLSALSFHHRDRSEKSFHISNNSQKFETNLKESQKCELLCIRCHFEEEDRLYVPQPTISKDLNCYELNRPKAMERKRELVGMKGGKCQKCGYSECLRCMSFHHREPELKCIKLDIRNIGNLSWTRIVAEVDKCDLYCVRCHAELEDEIRKNSNK